jgi:hypothetical protein
MAIVAIEDEPGIAIHDGDVFGAGRLRWLSGGGWVRGRASHAAARGVSVAHDGGQHQNNRECAQGALQGHWSAESMCTRALSKPARPDCVNKSPVQGAATTLSP